MNRSVLRRWVHRRALAATGLAALVACAVLYVTRGDTEAPYRPGETVAGVTDVHRRIAAGFREAVHWKDVAASMGLAFRHFSGGARSTQLPEDMGSGCAFGDYDRDGDWDLFVADIVGPLTLSADERRRAPGGCRLYRNDGGAFTDVTEEAGLGGLKGTFLGAAWGDYDNDGYPDLVVTSYDAIRLFHNRGDGSFEDVSERSGLAAHRGFWTGATWADVDGDGRLDLYVCGYVDYRFDPRDTGRLSKFRTVDSPFTINPSSYPPIPNLYFHNEGGGRFREMAEEAGISNPAGRSLSATFGDFDNDGRPDLYVANDVSEGAFYVNQGNGLFADRGHEAHVADYRGAMGIAVGDVDGDGALDMFVTHWIAEANALYLNKLLTGPAMRLDFEDAAERLGLGEISTDDIAWGTAMLDFDADGRPDIVVANGSTFEDPGDRRRLVPMPMRLFRNLGAGGFVDVAPTSGAALTVPRVARGLAIADVDGDLREEIAVVVHGGTLVLLKAEGGPPNHRVAFRLEGTASNRSAYGARLTLEAGGKAQVREIGAGSSYLSQNAPEAIFGLGPSTVVGTLSVRWPSGARQVFHQIPADHAYLIVEGHGAPQPVGDARAHTLAFWDAYRRARTLAAAGRGGEAISAYREALALNPRHEDCLYALGNLQVDSGDWWAARGSFEALLAVAPRSVRGHGALGDLLADPRCAAGRDLAAARRHYAEAGSLNGEETGWVERLGEVALAEGDVDGAQRYFQKVLATNARSFPALYLSGSVAWRQGRRREAEELFDRAFKALAPHAGPAPGEGDARVARKALPNRGAFSDQWAMLARGPIRIEDAYSRLEGR
jgi:tetratricopeptide (TPR) repeat protein